jgi:hypothetical protein
MNQPHAAPRLSPKLMAGVYDQFVAARWRGEDAAADSFAVWFEHHWTSEAPPEPDDPPEAASILGGAGSGIRWYGRDDVVLGYVAGLRDGCYAVSVADTVPSLRAPWERQPEPAVDDDHVLHVVGFNSGEPRPLEPRLDLGRDRQGQPIAGTTRPALDGQPMRERSPLPGALISEVIARHDEAER